MVRGRFPMPQLPIPSAQRGKAPKTPGVCVSHYDNVQCDNKTMECENVGKVASLLYST
jgi:hypothetical protein